MRNNGAVALVGRRLEHNDHLGIGYLEAALAGAGVRSSRHVLNHVDDVLPIARSICRQPPDVVGISLQDGGSAVLPLALGELLRRLGYPGHITAGGPFATLARTWLLGRYAWLDSVVRFAGEAPLLALVRARAQGESVAGVPGLSTRAGDGPPADVLSLLPTTLVPVRHEGMRMLGHKVAHVSATRGCAGRCSYCGPAALQNAEVEEGLRAGHSRRHLAAFANPGCDNASVDQLNQLGQEATDALAGIDPSGCKLYPGTFIDNSDYDKLGSAISSCEAAGYSVGCTIVLDSNGAVVDVRSRTDGSSNSQVLNCILTALSGLTFPCLANTQLCPEEVIVE